MKKVREKLNAKLRKSGGFTLVEMLIVVAIIAILIVISLPLVSGSLEKARVGVDEANERTAMSMAKTYFLLNSRDMGYSDTVTTCDLYYEVDPKTHEGEVKLEAEVTADNFKYGQSSEARTVVGADAVVPKGKGVIVTVSDEGDITAVKWGSTT